MITPFEVLKYSPAGFTYPTASFCEIIPQIEEAYGRECLGQEFWTFVISKKNQLPVGLAEWQAGITYTTGNKVIRYGCIFTSTATGNTSDPVYDATKWAIYPRFTDTGLENLWVKYLRRIFAIKVYLSSLPFTTYVSSSGGLTVNSGDHSGFRTANKGEINDVKNALLKEIQTTEENMFQFLKTNGTFTGFDGQIGVGGNCGSISGCATAKARKGRRFAWKF